MKRDDLHMLNGRLWDWLDSCSGLLENGLDRLHSAAERCWDAAWDTPEGQEIRFPAEDCGWLCSDELPKTLDRAADALGRALDELNELLPELAEPDRHTLEEFEIEELPLEAVYAAYGKLHEKLEDMFDRVDLLCSGLERIRRALQAEEFDLYLEEPGRSEGCVIYQTVWYEYLLCAAEEDLGGLYELIAQMEACEALILNKNA